MNYSWNRNRMLCRVLTLLVIGPFLEKGLSAQGLNRSRTISDGKIFSYWSFDNDTVGHAVDGIIEVRLKGIDAGKDYMVEVFHPGVEEAVVIQVNSEGEDYILNVPVKRRCATVHLKKI